MAGNAGKGRPRGVPNRLSGELREMILESLHAAGGVAYLSRMADEQPAAYLSLLAKLLPLEASLDAGPGQFVVSWLPPTN
jgi:hypothetical protein